MKIILETPRLTLREFKAGDAEALAHVLCDSETMRHYPISFDRQAVEEWIARNQCRYAEHRHGLWAMDLRSSGEMIGDCGITLQEADGEWLPEIGYHLRRDLWGQGLATEAARSCRDYGFRQLAVDSLISLIRPENVPSRRVAEKTAMKVWKETIRSGMLHLVYRIQKKEWRSSQAT